MNHFLVIELSLKIRIEKRREREKHFFFATFRKEKDVFLKKGYFFLISSKSVYVYHVFVIWPKDGIIGNFISVSFQLFKFGS